MIHASSSLSLLSRVLPLLVMAVGWVFEHWRRAAVESRNAAARARHAVRLAEMSRRVVSAQEAERARLAIELHDRTAANLAAIQLNLKSIERRFASVSDEDRELMQETGELLADSVASIRGFCEDLRPAVLDYSGLSDAIGGAVAQFGRRTGIEAGYEAEVSGQRGDKDAETAIFRIVQEALLNIAKHASARHVRVRLERSDEQLVLVIEDDGVGFDTRQLGQGGTNAGQGLLNMRDRAVYAGGSMTIASSPGAGTRLRLQIP